MNVIYDPSEKEGVMAARESFSGKPLSDTQFDEFMDCTKFPERDINTKGAYKEDVKDLAYTMARRHNMKPARAENIIRDLFKARTGMTMNEMLTQLRDNFQALTPEQKQTADPRVEAIQQRVENGDKITFNRALAHEANTLATELNITDAAATSLIKDSFEVKNEQSFYDWGKELDKQFYRPQIEAEKQARAAERQQTQSYSRSR